jgi:cellulose synthase/poly-beta-1,6-N-acetylglucosamine synthase-like glycosyltransferase
MEGGAGTGRARERPEESGRAAATSETARARWTQLAGLERVQLGQLLVRAKLITPRQLDEALARQFRWGSRLGDIVLSSGWVKPLDFYRVLAEHFELQFVNLVEQPADGTLFQPARYGDYAKHLYLPWRRENGVLWIATAEPTSPHMRELLSARQDAQLVMTSKFDILWELQRVAGTALSRQAVHHLASFDPERSAHIVFTREQRNGSLVLALLLAASLIAFPLPALIALNGLLNVFLFVSFVFRTLLCWMSCSEQVGLTVTDEEVRAISDRDLPLYSILVPMYKEPTVLPILAAALKRMDYPLSKLDIKLVLEEGDEETITAAKELALDSSFEIVRVPPSQPKTKPKACNYALRLCRGQYVTIYDAEDKPEADQLKKAVAAFRKLGQGTACIQARLNYFNAEENWLTRMFTLEYSLWFDMFLPALDRLRVPIPLGGTSNHFDLEKLREVGAWDPFNVTEDADLGLRFAAKGYHVSVVNSVTYEEANSHVGNWIRQRSRWVKGYMQTWLVNMRHPVKLLRRVGWSGFLTFQLFVGGTILSGLLYPFLVVPFLAWLLTRTAALHVLFPPGVLAVSLANLIVGNSCLIYLSMLAVAKRKHHALLPYALTVPGYWILQSLAAYKAVVQLITKPFYWEKTQHGISRFTNQEVARANAARA